MKFLSAILTQTSGSIGGATGATNRGGNYLRSRVAPVQPRTVKQQAVRATLASVSSSWRGLTATNIAGWNSLASSITLKDSLGNSYKPSGSQLFTGLNTTLLAIGATAITVPPAGAPDFPDLKGITATATAGTPALAVVPGIGVAPTGFQFFVRATAQLSPGKSYFGTSAYRFVEVLASTAYSSLNILSAYEAAFGAPIAGQKIAIAVSLVQTSSGFRSTEATTTVIVGA